MKRAAIAFSLLLSVAAGRLDAAGAPNPGPYEVDARGWTASPAAALLPPASAETPWRQFQDRHPGWMARWNTQTGTPVRSAGPAIPLESRPTTATQAAEAAQNFLTRELGAWVEGGDLQLLRAAPDGNGWWVQYTQSYRGLRVVGGRAYARISALGTVPLFGLDLEPRVEAEVTPVLDEAAARAAALRDFPPEASQTVRSVELVVLPVAGNGKTAFRTAYQVDFTTRDPFGAWVAYVDASTGEVLWRQSVLHSIDITGSVSAGVESVTVGDNLQVRPLPHVRVSLFDTALIGNTVTGPDGSFLLSAPGGGDDTLQAGLAGPFGYVVNLAFGNETPRLAIPFDPDSTSVLPVRFDEDNSRIQDRDAFHSAMLAHDYIRQVDPGFSLLDYPMYLLTDLPGQQCNAFWDGYGLTFFAPGNICVDMARIASVVIHEYGHGITDFQYRPFFPSAEMHEGFSDYFAATLLNDPRIGLGFFGPGTVLRTVDNDLRYPDDVTEDPHATGLIIAGALWDLRTVLGAGATDHLWHFARNGFADNFDDYCFDLLVTDDDDGNVYNGTPDFNPIVNAFRKHGIGDYSIHVVHEPIRDTENTNQSIPITASFLSVFAIVDSSVVVHLAIDTGGGLLDEARHLLPTGGVREYGTVLAPQPAETAVTYWFTARDTAGTEVTYPAPGHPFRFRIGTDTTPPVIVHDALRDQPVDAARIAFRARVTDNLDKGIDSVRVVRRRGNDPADSLTLSATGDDVYQGSLFLPALQIGETIRYRIQVADSAVVPNVAVVPDTGWNAFDIVRGLGRDFEDDDGGLSAAGGWEWGSPEPLVHAYSGAKVWGTVLSGQYSDNMLATLVVGPVDLSAFTTAGLYFRHFYDTEEFFDGGAVYASTDSGATWQPLVPDGEYPFPLVSALGGPGYSGRSGQWTDAAFPLNAYVGVSSLLLKLQFQSDEAVAGLGWYVDDLEVVERQVLSRPLALTALSGKDGQVPLAWSPPVGIDPDAAGTPLLGYHVNRGLPGETPVRITGVPVAGTQYVDSTPSNGVFYVYSVRAVYADGESAPTAPVEAIPYVAVFAGSTDTLLVTSPPGQPADAVIHFGNSGTGFLKVNLWPTDSGRTLADARIRYTIHAGSGFVRSGEPSGSTGHPGPDWALVTKKPRGILPPGAWQLVYRDPEDHADSNVPDIDSVEVQVGNDSFYLRITGHRPWGPLSTWNIRASLDTDLDPGTNPLGEYSIVAGAQVLNLAGVPAVLLDHAGRQAGPVHHVAFPAPNVMEFGVFLGSIGSPDEVFLQLRALNASATSTLDQAPEGLPLPWLGLDAQRVALFQGGGQDVHLHFSALSAGNYEGQILLETNDPLRPLITLPVTYTVSAPVPVDLLSFQGVAGDLGVRLEWRVADSGDLVGFNVLRSEASGGTETTLTPTPLTGSDGKFVFDDGNVVDGHDYQYRLLEVSRTGDTRLHGPVSVHYAGVSGFTTAVLRPTTPNPMRNTASIRFGLPAESDVTLRVYSVSGRLVRELANRVHYARGFHELRWDGRDEDGRVVSAGVFPFLLETGGVTRHGKITVLR
jgi:immune inhibitor InhA-like protein